MNAQILSHFINFVSDRDAMRCRREAGQPWPWTDDPILKSYKFCNVRREDDRVTNGIAKIIRQRYSEHPDAWFPLTVARRAVNWPDTLADLMAENALLPWHPDRFRDVIRRKQAAATKAFEAQAYKVIVSGKSGEQANLICEHVLNPLWARREHFRTRPGDTLLSFARRLWREPNMGPFFAGQIVADLKHVQLRAAEDWWTFAVSGPGSRRGLDRIHGRSPRKYWHADYDRQEELWYPVFREFYDLVREPIREVTGLLLDAQDVQNCLCEYDKYCRLKNGEGVNSVRRYVYRPEQKQQPIPTKAEATVKDESVQPNTATTIALPQNHCAQPVAIPAQSSSAIAATAPELSEQEKQLAQLNARWKKIARQYTGSPRWEAPSEYTWMRLLGEVPFIVLYRDVLVRLAQFSDCVRADAITYMEMIIANDGAKFARERGLALPAPKLIDDEEEDGTVPLFVSHFARSAER